MAEKSSSESHHDMPAYLERLKAYVGKLTTSEMDLIQLLINSRDAIMHRMPRNIAVFCTGILQRAQLKHDLCLVIVHDNSYVKDFVKVMKELDREQYVKVETCDAILNRHLSTFKATDVNVAVGTSLDAHEMVMNRIYPNINMIAYNAGKQTLDSNEAYQMIYTLKKIIEKLGKIQRDAVQIDFLTERELPRKVLLLFKRLLKKPKIILSESFNQKSLPSFQHSLPLLEDPCIGSLFLDEDCADLSPDHEDPLIGNLFE